MPKVSVIAPVYKVEQYLHRCVDSILSQTFRDFELILVDDGSPDSCGVICDEYEIKDSRVKVLHIENGGVSRARNKGLDIAKGKYIAFCDSDDWWEPQLLERTVFLMESGEWDWVSFQFQRVCDDGSVAPHQYHTGEKHVFSVDDKMEYMLREFLQCRYGWEIWARIFRADIIQDNQIRFCETCGNYAEDMGFCAKYLLCARSFLTIGDCLYNYYQRPNSMMATSVELIKLNELNEVSFDVCAFAKKNLPSTIYKSMVGVIHFQVLYNQFSRLFYTEKFRLFRNYVRKVQRQDWFFSGACATIRNWSTLKAFYGKNNALLISNLAFFCLHRCWNLYAILKRCCKLIGGKG